ncbi:MAG: hypothetical protein AAGF60_00085 [Pseudomonadota bacterium]
MTTQNTILHKHDAETARIEDLLNSVHDTVRGLRNEVKELTTKLGDGEDETEKDTKAKVTRLHGVVDMCHKVEMHLVSCKQKSGAGRGGHSIDLRAARAEIGCRLARLAECCGA